MQAICIKTDLNVLIKSLPRKTLLWSQASDRNIPAFSSTLSSTSIVEDVVIGYPIHPKRQNGFPVLLSAKVIQNRIAKMAALIESYYKDKTDRLFVVGIADGVIPFMNDLTKRLKLNCNFATLKTSSYEGEKQTSIKINEEQLNQLVQKVPVKSHVLILDDILDTGNTLTAVKKALKTKLPGRTFKVAVLLDKPERRVKNAIKKADFTGFTIPNAWVGGYGMDLLEDDPRRNLSCIVYKEK